MKAEHPTNEGEGEQPIPAVHEIPRWAKFVLIAIFINVATCVMFYNMGHDDGMTDGADKYAVTVGTVAERLPYECKEYFLHSLKQEMRQEIKNNTGGD